MIVLAFICIQASNESRVGATRWLIALLCNIYRSILVLSWYRLYLWLWCECTHNRVVLSWVFANIHLANAVDTHCTARVSGLGSIIFRRTLARCSINNGIVQRGKVFHAQRFAVQLALGIVFRDRNDDNIIVVILYIVFYIVSMHTFNIRLPTILFTLEVDFIVCGALIGTNIVIVPLTWKVIAHLIALGETNAGVARIGSTCSRVAAGEIKYAYNRWDLG